MLQLIGTILFAHPSTQLLEPKDRPIVRRIVGPMFRPGEAYAFSPDITEWKRNRAGDKARGFCRWKSTPGAGNPVQLTAIR